MTSVAQSCPACGAPLNLLNRFDALIRCEYCGTMVEVSYDQGGSGEVRLNQTASRFSVGQTGTLQDRAYTIGARIKFAYPGGAWDEFYLTFDDGETAWLQEDEGELTVFSKEPLKTAVKIDEVSVGDVLTINEHEMFVTEKTKAVVAEVDGTLPYTVNVGEAYQCLDGNIDGQIYSLEISHDEIALSQGESVEFSDFKFN